ncbi:polyketide synthase dehydratase domain-containing protein [Methylosinus sp. H3A]|uniref:polyketide synthase dehydratase domain-containing protein n=1 Tax=Methylosinus sp. H3A TaxID=2785786 RepID=UPI0018C23CBF|nr:polyketide synthase dehydratase domain-containing protein [Methylosinus sp. H3A]MBG0810447.1 polyketide synthase dehydratase domain-containing protein [Methylosinus sp. H3A]
MDAVLEAQDRIVSRRGGALPFVGRVIAATPGESVLVERVLHLDEDLYLADHAFVHAPGVKPLSACLPVLPMTMSIEAMAEVAACVVPGQGLIGVEEIKATRWIDLVDVEATILTIEARLDRYDPQREATFVRAAIRAEGQSGPSIEATLLFGRHYLLELFPDFGALDAGTALRIDAASLYAERHLFHGPAFRCLFGEVFVEDQRIAGHLRVPSPTDLFRSTVEPQLLLQPCVLDAICQMVGVYAMQRDRYAFPVGLGKLELYRPTPPAGTVAPVRIELRKTDGKTIHADVEAEDGEGGVWMRIADLRCWKFQWERRLVDHRRAPGQFLLGRPAPVDNSATGPLALLLAEPDLGKFDPRMLARDCLGLEEAAVYESYARFPARQRQWLLGRTVAKDCVRRWISDRTGAEMAHPAAIVIRSDPAGRPYVAGEDGREALPHVSIAHCEDRAIAAAHSGRVGVDIERIADRDDGFLAAVAGPDEREKVKALGRARRAEWITRLWGAKEAVGKLLGSGVDGRLKSLEAVDFSPEGSVRIQDRATMFVYAVETIESEGFIIACATEDAPLPPRGEECASA